MTTSTVSIRVNQDLLEEATRLEPLATKRAILDDALRMWLSFHLKAQPLAKAAA